MQVQEDREPGDPGEHGSMISHPSFLMCGPQFPTGGLGLTKPPVPFSQGTVKQVSEAPRC